MVSIGKWEIVAAKEKREATSPLTSVAEKGSRKWASLNKVYFVSPPLLLDVLPPWRVFFPTLPIFGSRKQRKK